jgi:hypothetical protein
VVLAAATKVVAAVKAAVTKAAACFFHKMDSLSNDWLYYKAK